MKDNISTENYIVMVGDKIIIPESFRSVILEKLHLAHQGVQRTKAKARKVLYWPGMGRGNGGEVCAVPAATAQTPG